MTRQFIDRGRAIGTGEDQWNATRNRPFTDFGPFVPLFVPWTRMWHYCWWGRRKQYLDLLHGVLSCIKPSFLYVTFVVNSFGVEGRDERYNILPPNLLILSAGGKGHIPLLLWSTTYNPSAFPITTNYHYDVVFLGVLFTHWLRRFTADFFQRELGNRTRIDLTPEWRDVYATSKYILAPRGGGRNSYRLAEILQMGMVPIYVYNDIIWLPYYDSINWRGFSLVVRFDKLASVLPIIRNTTGEEIARMRARVHELYETHFSVQGTFDQIFKFLGAGFDGSDLRCAPYSSRRW
jgi:hypothetical protein